MKVLELNDPRVQEAKCRFEKNQKRHAGCAKSRIGFDDYFKLFSNDCNSFERIAEIAGISREGVRQIYNKHFKGLLPGKKTGRLRRRVCALKWHKIAAKELPKDSVARHMALAAMAAGCEVEQIEFAENNFRYATRALRVNGKKCLIFERKACHKNKVMASGRRHTYAYANFECSNLALRKSNFLILLQRVPGYPKRIFVVPTEILQETNAPNGYRLRKHICIPLRKLPGYKKRPKIDFFLYENAWELIRPLKA